MRLYDFITYWGEDGCRLGNRNIAEALGISERSVAYYLRILRDRGLIASATKRVLLTSSVWVNQRRLTATGPPLSRQ